MSPNEPTPQDPNKSAGMGIALLNNRYLLWLSIFMVMMAGISALMNMPRLEDPRITHRNPAIFVFYPGVSAERIEALVTKPIEDELLELSELKKIESTTRDGIATFAVELQDWTDASNNEQIFSKIRDRLSQVAPTLPKGASAPIFDDKRQAVAYTLITAIQIKDPNLKGNALTPADEAIQARLAEELAERLRVLPGTDLVEVTGSAEEQINVLVDAERLNQLGISTTDLAALISAADVKSSAGRLQTDDQLILIEVEGDFSAIDRIKSIPIATQGGSTITLDQVASVERGFKQPRAEVSIGSHGNSVALVSSRMGIDLRSDVWTAAAKSVVDDFEQEFGYAINIENVFEQNRYTEQRLSSLAINLILGVLVVMAVVLLFMGWRSALIVGLALPLSMSATLFCLSALGYQIHQMTIFGLIIAIGLLIDNAIVVSDEVRKNLQIRGMRRTQALQSAISHLKVPLLASTLTTVLGFMPVLLLPGGIGDFIGSIAISVVLALTFSLLISLTIIITLSAIYIPKTDPQNASLWHSGVSSERFLPKFDRLLSLGLKRPWLSALAVVGLSFAGVGLATTLPNVFFPSADRDYFVVNVQMAPNSSLEQTTQVTRDIQTLINQQQEVKRSYFTAGASFPSVYYNMLTAKENFPSYAQGVVFADSVKSAQLLIPKLQAIINDQVLDAKVTVKAFGQGPPNPAPVSFELTGPSSDTLRELGERLVPEILKRPGVTQVSPSIEGGQFKLQLKLDEQKVRLAGLTLSDVARQFQSQLEGVSGGAVLENLTELPVVVQATTKLRGDLAQIEAIRVLDAQGQPIPVRALGDLVLMPALTQVTRKQGERVNTISAFITADAAPIDISSQVMAQTDSFNLPPGYELKLGGDADSQSEALGQLSTYLPILLLLMVATLILSFRSLILAALISSVAVLSVGMGFLSLWISGYSIGFNPIIGSAGLIGVAINGSIVVLAAIEANPLAKLGDPQAIKIETMAGSRHIISTTLTTVAGFVPLLISGGTFWPPLAVVIAGGVGFSIILSLWFTPISYRLIRARRWKKYNHAIDAHETGGLSGEGRV